MAAAEDELLLPRLPELFETSKQLLDEVEIATEPTGSRIIQDKVFKGLDLLKKAAEMLSQLNLFSQNEDLEEIASTDLKYLMVPAFQGAFALKQVWLGIPTAALASWGRGGLGSGWDKGRRHLEQLPAFFNESG